MHDRIVDLPFASILIDPLWWPPTGHQCSTESPDVCFLFDFLHIGCRKKRGLEGEGQVKAGSSVKWDDGEDLEAGEWREIGAGHMKRQSGEKGEADKGTQCEGQVIP